MREERKRQAAANANRSGPPQAGKPPPYSPNVSEKKMLKASNHQPSMSSMNSLFAEIKSRCVPGNTHQVQPHVARSQPQATEPDGHQHYHGEDHGISPARPTRTSPPYDEKIRDNGESYRGFAAEQSFTPQRQREVIDEPVTPDRSLDEHPSIPSSPSEASLSIRQKARMRRQRYASSIRPATSTASVSPVRPESRSDSMASRYNDPVSSRATAVNPATTSPYGYSRTIDRSASDTGTQQPQQNATPRSAFRHRRRLEQRRLRQEAAVRTGP